MIVIPPFGSRRGRDSRRVRLASIPLVFVCTRTGGRLRSRQRSNQSTEATRRDDRCVIFPVPLRAFVRELIRSTAWWTRDRLLSLRGNSRFASLTENIRTGSGHLRHLGVQLRFARRFRSFGGRRWPHRWQGRDGRFRRQLGGGHRERRHRDGWRAHRRHLYRWLIDGRTSHRRFEQRRLPDGRRQHGWTSHGRRQHGRRWRQSRWVERRNRRCRQRRG